MGKSAQLPLQTWLPDAMAGPTPVSALIHAATMVTAGVYLIARMHALFELAPAVHAAGGGHRRGHAAAGRRAAPCVQRDIKRVLAYSTISQIGYMFLALGVGAWSAAIFHFVTHAFFKALLFLAAGVVILASTTSTTCFSMGGLRRQLPLIFWTFLVGALSLAALPLVTAGFYSKDLILYWVYAIAPAAACLWLAALLGVFLTSLYIFRLVFLAFFGPPEREPARRPGALLTVPLVVLAVLAALIGYLEMPRNLGERAAVLQTSSAPPCPLRAAPNRAAPPTCCCSCSPSWPPWRGSWRAGWPPGAPGGRPPGRRRRPRSGASSSTAGASTGCTTGCSCARSPGWRGRTGRTSWTGSGGRSPPSTAAWPGR